MQLYLLGSPRLEQDGNPLHLGRRKAIALLAYLAVTARSHNRDVLATLLWPEFDQSSARAELRRTLSVVNRALDGKQIEADRETIGLDQQTDYWLDVVQFRRLIAAVEAHTHAPDKPCPECISKLTEAVALYRDDFMSGFALPDSPPFDQWQRYQSERLKDELTAVLAQLVDWHAAEREYDTAITCARRWLELDPLHERAHRNLMSVLALSGQRSSALGQYKACYRLLAEELDVGPSKETTRLFERIRDGKLERESKTERKGTPRRHNLPPQLTPFIGRQALLAEIRDRLEDPACHLLTLVGPGGSGKTRLALQVASGFVSDETADGPFPDGVTFVPLAQLRSSDAIAPAIIQALDVATSHMGDPRDIMLDYLRQKKLLLVLDNYEHLLARSEPGGGEPGQRERGDVDIVRALLRTEPAVKLLVTSRAALNLEGEQLYPVGGMDLPPLPAPLPFAPTGSATSQEQQEDFSVYSTVQLFIVGARRVRPGFSPTADDLAHVARVCHLTDGLPLAILLAAGWIRVLSPVEIANEVRRRYDFLETQVRGTPRRQSGVRATFDYSWDLLTERERIVLARLSVFRGGCTREAVEHITDASLRDLMALVNQSLLQSTVGGRYEMHELLRQYAAEKLALSPSDEEDAWDRHCAYYTTAVQRWMEEWKGPRRNGVRTEMDADIENINAAWDWAVQCGQLDRLECAVEVWVPSLLTGIRKEGEPALQAAGDMLAKAEDRSPATSVDRLSLWTKVLAWQGVSCWWLGRVDTARQLVQQSLELLDHPALAGQDTRLQRAIALRAKGIIDYFTVDRDAAREPLERNLALYRVLGDRRWTADTLGALGTIARNTGPLETALRLHREALAIHRTLGVQEDIANDLVFLAVVLMQQGRYGQAENLQREAVAICEETGDRLGLESAQRHLALTLICSGRYAESHTFLEACVGTYEEFGTSSLSLGHANTKLAHAQLHLGQYKATHQRGNKGLVCAGEGWDVWGAGFALLVLGRAALAEGAHIEAQHVLQESVDILYSSKNLDFAYWALPSLAHVELVLGQLHKAEHHLRDTLQPALEQGHGFALMSALPVMALLQVEKGRAERAVEVYALASRYEHVANSRWWEDVAGKQITAVTSTLPPAVVAAAQERGRARNLEETVAVFLADMGS